MLQVQVTDLWKKAFQNASIGCLVLSGLNNPGRCDELETAKRNVETELRRQFTSKQALSGHKPIQAYTEYYRRYAKTYHVLQQLESIIFKNKTIPQVAGLVEAMFMAELKNCLLTAGHDLALLQGPLMLDITTGEEKYTLLNGKEQQVKAGDMILSDSAGIISSIIYGPDARTRLSSDTKQAVFTVYAPAGISRQSVLQHLADIHAYVRLIAPNVQTDLEEVFPV